MKAAKSKGELVGVKPYSLGCVVADVDTADKQGNPYPVDENRERVIESLGAPLCEVKTRRGGYHLWYPTSAEIGNSAKQGIDIRCSSGYVVLWDANTVATALENVADYDPVDPSAWPFVKAKAAVTPVVKTGAALKPTVLEELFKTVPPTGKYDFAGNETVEGGRPAWVKITAAWREAGATWEQFDQWAQGGAGYDPDDNLKIWETTEPKDGGATRKTLFKIARQFGYKGGIVWAVTSDRGAPLRAASENVILALSEFPEYEFTYNEFTERDMINGENATDKSIAKLSRIMQQTLHFAPSKDALHEGVSLLCDEKPFHPIRDYLQGLEWDGRLRLARFAETYFGTDGNPLVNAAARLIPLGMAGRILQPGCKFDYAPVLQGEQGCGKTSSLRILATDDLHSDSITLTSFDPAKMVIERSRGRWVVELAELAGFRYSDQENVKTLVSGQEDSARLAWGRTATDVLRQFIFVGTTNAETFLRDTTGGRRFPIVPCGRIDLEGLEADRDMILAEAVQDAQKILPDAITIPPALFDSAMEQAEERRTVGGFEEWLDGYVDKNKLSNGIVSKDLRESMKDDLAGTPIYPSNVEFSQVMEGKGYRQVRKGADRIRQWIRQG